MTGSRRALFVTGCAALELAEHVADVLRGERERERRGDFENDDRRGRQRSLRDRDRELEDQQRRLAEQQRRIEEERRRLR
jgi:hypothetical protein